MSLITTCPACGTAFRITPEQLSAHRGDVRCGQCQHIFSALKQLAEVAASPPATTPQGSFPLVDAPSSEQAAPFPEPRQATEPVAAELAAMLEPAPDTSPPQAEEAPSTPLPFVILEAETPDLETAADAPPLPVEDVVAEPAAVIAPPVEEIILGLPEPAPEIAPPPSAGSKPPFSVQRAKRSLSWLLIPLALLLTLTAVGQAAYFLRTELAAHFPQTKPLLIAACNSLHCTVELPRQADLLNIEDSDLQDDPEHTGALVLVSTLYNRAPYAQAYPLLELTLTDTFDKPVLRRTLAPREYLPNNTGLAAGIPAGGEINVRLALGVTGAKPAGYRLYVKY